jgi:hypothetical protein
LAKFLLVGMVAFALFFGHDGSVATSEPYWSCHRESYFQWVGWPDFFEKKYREVCEVAYY